MSRRIKVRGGTSSYEIVVGRPLEQFSRVFAGLAGKAARVLVVTDRKIVSSYGKKLLQGLRQEGFQAHLTQVPSGERSKTLAQAERLYRLCAQAGLERRSWLIALGGGVIGDLAGFVAATYLRGIGFVQVPTTLLAQVDAAIGGKTGVDIPEGKNLVGCFYQPRLVWIDPALLRTLPKSHWHNGLAEVIKYAAIGDRALFATLEKHMESLLQGLSAPWVSIIGRCAEMKARIVERDPFETRGVRSLLNFGHSVGHAIEAATDFSRYLHGEAIAIGMFVAAFISQQAGLIDSVERIRLGTLLTRAGLPSRVDTPIPRARILEFLSRDKKVANGSVRFVLLKGIGKAEAGQAVSPEALDIALSASGL